MDVRAARVAIVCLALLASATELRAGKLDPKAKLIEPERGERRFVAPANIPLEAQLQVAAERFIVRVEFFANDAPIGEAGSAPYALNWASVPEGEYRLRVRATDSEGASDWSPIVRVRVAANREPRVRLTEPRQDAQFHAPASITLEAQARDRDHNLARVEFYVDGALVGTSTTEPYTLSWAPVPSGDHVLLAKAIDATGATAESRPVRIHVLGNHDSGVAKLYFIHVDHLNTPRLITDDQQRTVWRWDQQEPFGNDVPDENPGGLGRFDLPLRLPGQYFDKETNLHYNYYRDYDASIGRYGQSDPIGLRAGLNTYAYVLSNPLSYLDPFGLDVKVCYYYEAAGGFGHIGFGVGAETGTQGYYPTGNPFGSPGVIQDDTQKTKECKVIPATPDQDNCMLDCRARRKNDPGTYVLTSNQCTSFVRECLKICGLPASDYSGSAPRPQFLGLPGKSR
jgi:RHS repeat-associated protein